MPKKNSKTYRLSDDRSGEAFLLKVGRSYELSVFDPDYIREDGKKGARRAIRHCPNQKSIFIDEQDKYALVEPIIFVNGYLEVPNEQPITQEFLDAHPSNLSNGGHWFELIDEEKEAKNSIETEELSIDVKYEIRRVAKKKDGIHELKAIASVFLGSIDQTDNMGIEELKQYLYGCVEDDITRFVDESGRVTIFEDGNVTRKYIILRALKDGILKKSKDNKSLMWVKGNSIITTAPSSIDNIQFFADFLATDEGVLVSEEIAKRS